MQMVGQGQVTNMPQIQILLWIKLLLLIVQMDLQEFFFNLSAHREAKHTCWQRQEKK